MDFPNVTDFISWWYMLDCVGRVDDTGSRRSLPKNCVSVISTLQLPHVIHCVSSIVTTAVVSQPEHFDCYGTPPEKQGQRKRWEGERDCYISRFQLNRCLGQSLGGIQSWKRRVTPENSSDTACMSFSTLYTLKVKIGRLCDWLQKESM